MTDEQHQAQLISTARLVQAAIRQSQQRKEREAKVITRALAST